MVSLRLDEVHVGILDPHLHSHFDAALHSPATPPVAALAARGAAAVSGERDFYAPAVHPLSGAFGAADIFMRRRRTHPVSPLTRYVAVTRAVTPRAHSPGVRLVAKGAALGVDFAKANVQIRRRVAVASSPPIPSGRRSVILRHPVAQLEALRQEKLSARVFLLRRPFEGGHRERVALLHALPSLVIARSQVELGFGVSPRRCFAKKVNGFREALFHPRHAAVAVHRTQVVEGLGVPFARGFLPPERRDCADVREKKTNGVCCTVL